MAALSSPESTHAKIIQFDTKQGHWHHPAYSHCHELIDQAGRSSHARNKEEHKTTMKHAYVARDSTGCIVDVVAGAADEDYVKPALAEMHARGLTVEHMPIDDANRLVRHCFGTCRHGLHVEV